MVECSSSFNDHQQCKNSSNSENKNVNKKNEFIGFNPNTVLTVEPVSEPTIVSDEKENTTNI